MHQVRLERSRPSRAGLNREQNHHYGAAVDHRRSPYWSSHNGGGYVRNFAVFYPRLPDELDYILLDPQREVAVRRMGRFSI